MKQLVIFVGCSLLSCVTVPVDEVDAKAPLMTLGSTNAGTRSAVYDADSVTVSRWKLESRAELRELRAYLAGRGVDGTQPFRAVIYADAGGTPGALLAISESVEVSGRSGAGWVSFALPTALELGEGEYWFGLHGGYRNRAVRFFYEFAPERGFRTLDSFADGPQSQMERGSRLHAALSIHAVYSDVDIADAAEAQTGKTPVSFAVPTVRSTTRRL